MMPALIGGVMAASSTIVWAITSGGTAGMSYAIGRKYGRVICEKLDVFENKIKHLVPIRGE